MYKVITITFLVFTLLSCNTSTTMKSYPFYLGTYTNEASEGIYKGKLHADGTFDTLKLAAVSQNPSFLSFAHDKRVLLAVNEVDANGLGAMESFIIDNESLRRVDSAISGGAHPCHLNVNTKGEVLMANYTGGNIGLLKVNENGQLSELLDAVQHIGLQSENDKKAHAHSVWFTGNEQEALALDLGLDQVYVYNIKDQKIVVMDSLAMVVGSGPRHLVYHPKYAMAYVVNELNSTVTVLGKLEGHWEILNTVSTLPADFNGKSYCADIRISADGRFLYASNRGHNSLVIYQIGEQGKALEPIAYEPVKGKWPRNFALTADGAFLVVANQHTNNLVAFKRDANTGLLQFTDELKGESPVCILFE